MAQSTPPSATIALPLSALKNVGPATVADLNAIGITTTAQLVGKDPFKLFDQLCHATKTKHDPCMIDVFMSAVDQANGNPPEPWWSYTAQRKAQRKERLA